MTQSTLSPQDFVNKWRKAELKERSAAQEHFIVLCWLLGLAAEAEGDLSHTGALERTT